MAEFKTKEIIVRLESNKKGTKIIGKQCGKIVRCKDCVYHGEFNESDWCTCEITGAGTHKDGFCSDGEGKTDNT